MILIGENLNVMSKTIKPAMRERDPEPIRELARSQTEAGVHYIDVNLGPARKGGAELMEWMVHTIQEVTDLPLFLDTTNVQAIEAGLRAYEDRRGKAVINSVSARPERMEALLPVAARHGAGIVALLLGVEGIPRDAAERGANAADLLYHATQAGIQEEDIWFDPIVLPVNSQQDQVRGCTEFMMMFRDIAPGCKSTCGLSNVSNGAPPELRPILNRTYFMILRKYGLDSAIIDAFDEEIAAIGRGTRRELEALVGRVMDGEEFSFDGLSQREIDYVKTARVLRGDSLYSDSWLQL
ncbi:MAG: dihydropteroate synthase [Candidatus Bipolaricaulia bacterium]